MKPRNRLLPVLALLVGAAIVQHADAATTLTVNCTFTISKDVHIVWLGTNDFDTAGTHPVTNTTGTITWAIGAATLGTSYSTVGTTDGWTGATTDTLAIKNTSLTGDGVDLSVTASSTGWTAAASAGADQFVAAVTANATPPANTAAVIAAASAKLTPTNAAFAANVAATSATAPLWFAITVPSSITTGGGSKTIAYVFTGAAH